MSLLQASGISVHDGAGRTLLHPVSLNLVAGEPLVVLGETGSGKSLLAQAIMGTLPGDLSASGQVLVDGQTLDASQSFGFRALWGRKISVLPQEPWLSLDPLMRARTQVAETHRLVRALAPAQAKAAADSDLATLDLAGAGAKYPHQLSGGMAQRVAFAAARAGGARIVIADEPTKGLDAGRRDEVARLLLDGLGSDGGLLVITHDLQLARRIGGKAIVIREGAVVESGPTEQLFTTPQAEYTRHLLAADPEHWPANQPGPPGTALLTVEDLSLRRGDRVLAEGIRLTISAGQVLGVYGPSGCGKSTFGDVLLGLQTPAKGGVRQMVQAPPTAFQKLYQDPVAAFPPKRALGRTLRDVAQRFGKDSGWIAELLEKLSLSPALLHRRPDQVSGGELQRLALLRVLLTDPRLIFADEPTSRLDPVTQQQVIGLLAEVARKGCAVVLVSHDAALLEKVSDQRFDFPALS